MEKISYKKETIVSILENMEIIVEIIHKSKEDATLAEKFYQKGIHSADALHAALAINSKCDVLLTFNKKDFIPVQKLIKIREPNELIF